jgi:hypothetical protein
VQRAKAQSKTGIFRDYGVAEAPPGFQAGWSDCMYFSLFFVHHSRRFSEYLRADGLLEGKYKNFDPVPKQPKKYGHQLFI